MDRSDGYEPRRCCCRFGSFFRRRRGSDESVRFLDDASHVSNLPTNVNDPESASPTSTMNSFSKASELRANDGLESQGASCDAESSAARAKLTSVTGSAEGRGSTAEVNEHGPTKPLSDLPSLSTSSVSRLADSEKAIAKENSTNEVARDTAHLSLDLPPGPKSIVSHTDVLDEKSNVTETHGVDSDEMVSDEAQHSRDSPSNPKSNVSTIIAVGEKANAIENGIYSDDMISDTANSLPDSPSIPKSSVSTFAAVGGNAENHANVIDVVSDAPQHSPLSKSQSLDSARLNGTNEQSKDPASQMREKMAARRQKLQEESNGRLSGDGARDPNN